MTTLRTLPDDLRLDSGSHPPPNGAFEACVMEAVAYVAGEPWSDSPQCVCPVLASFGRSWNDWLPDDERQQLLPYIPRLIGTRSTPDVENRRAWMAADWLVRECAPAWLRLAGLDEHAHNLEQLAALTDGRTAEQAQPALTAARDAATAAGSAARSAARSAAGSAARSAAWSAARSAAWSAARSAAGSAASEALDPTRRGLQRSALALLDRMIECQPADLATTPAQ